VEDGVGGQQADQALGVAPLDGGEEAGGQLLALAAHPSWREGFHVALGAAA